MKGGIDVEGQVAGALEALARSFEDWARGPRRVDLLAELVVLLDEIDRARTEDDLEAAWRRLLSMGTVHDLRRFWEGRSIAAPRPKDRGPLRGDAAAGGGSFASRMRDTVNSLRSLVGARSVPKEARPAPIVTYPEAVVPQSEVREGQVFSVEVCASDDGGSFRVEIARDLPGPVDFDVALRLPPSGVVEACSSIENPLRILESGPSAKLTFSVRARVPGRHSMRAVLRKNGIDHVFLPVAVHVLSTDAPPSGAPPARAWGPLRGGFSEVFEGLVLDVDDRGEQAARLLLRMTLSSSLGGRRSVREDRALSEGVEEQLVRLALEMDEVRMLLGFEEREKRLRGIGRRLAEGLLPEAVRRGLAAADEGTALHVQSPDFWAPWELLWIDREGGGFFLGEHFAITRWLPEGSLWSELSGGPALFIVPPSDLDVAADAALLANVGAPVQTVTRIGKLLEALGDGPPCGFVHFACHGRAAPSEALGPRLPFDDGEVLRPDDVRGARTPRGALYGACVLVNACQVDLPHRGLRGHDGWAQVFIEAGAAAVVVPSWTVYEPRTAEFAGRFYHGLVGEERIGEAARRARIEARVTGSATRLAYAVYGSPTARLVRPA